MSARKEILFLAHRIPYPPDKGDKIRSYRLLKFLAERFDVHLAAFVDDRSDFAHRAFLEAICASVNLVALHSGLAKIKSLGALQNGKPLSIAYFHVPKMKQIIDELRERDLAVEIVFSSTMAQYVEAPVQGRPRIIDFCDADSEKFSAYKETATFPMKQLYAREGLRLADAENAIANWADASFAVTVEEAERFNRRPEIARPVDWWGNGVDTAYFDPQAEFPEIDNTADIVFTGAMDYRANVEAALFFVSEIWPSVRAAEPAATFAIVGARPDNALKDLNGRNGVHVTGRVDDIRPWIKQAKLAIAPLRVARGVQNKVLEAMAMGAAVVATSAAATGLRVKNGEELAVADYSEDFAAAVIGLLNDQQRRDHMGAASRARVLADYQWAAQLSRFEVVLNSMLAPSAAASLPGSQMDLVKAARCGEGV